MEDTDFPSIFRFVYAPHDLLNNEKNQLSEKQVAVRVLGTEFRSYCIPVSTMSFISEQSNALSVLNLW